MRIALSTPLLTTPWDTLGTDIGAELIERLLTAARFDVVTTDSGQAGSSESQPDVWAVYGAAATDPNSLIQKTEVDRPLLVFEPVLDPHATAPSAELIRVVKQAAAVITTDSEVFTRLKQWWPEVSTFVRFPAVCDPGPLLTAFQMARALSAQWATHLHFGQEEPWLVAGLPGGQAATEAGQLLARALTRTVQMTWRLIILVEDADSIESITSATLPLERTRIRICHVPDLQKRSGLLVSSSMFIWPGQGRLGIQWLLEAQAAGLPVVACQGPGVLDRVTDGLTGRIFPGGNAEALAGGVSFLLRHGQFRQTFSERARKAILENHDVDVVGQQIGPILNDLIQAR